MGYIVGHIVVQQRLNQTINMHAKFTINIVVIMEGIELLEGVR